MNLEKEQCQCCSIELAPNSMSLVNGKYICLHCETMMNIPESKYANGPKAAKSIYQAEEDFDKCLRELLRRGNTE